MLFFVNGEKKCIMHLFPSSVQSTVLLQYMFLRILPLLCSECTFVFFVKHLSFAYIVMAFYFAVL